MIVPYITQKRRDEIKKSVRAGKPPNYISPGDINFLFSSTINAYVKRKGLSYQTINDVVGALECAKIEFYERIAKPYELVKLKQNGDVYSL